MSYFGPAKSSDIYVVLQTIVESKQKIKLIQEDIKETIKGLLEANKDDITKDEVTAWVQWLMTPEKQHSDVEKLEEAQAKFDSIMSNRKQIKPMGEKPLDLEDLD